MKNRLLILFLLLSFVSYGQLVETNLTNTAIKTALGESTNNLGLLCTSSSVNKWSYKKPVFRPNATVSQWFREFNGKFSLNIVQGTVLNIGGSYTTGSWTYTKPTDLYGYRQGDFRGYLHTSSPMIEFEGNGQTPSEGGNVSNLDQSVQFYYNRAIATTNEGIYPSRLGYGGWYFGIYFSFNDGSAQEYWITLNGNDTIGASVRTVIDTDFSTNGLFDNVTASNTTVTWYAFISNTVIGNITTDTWDDSPSALIDVLMMPDDSEGGGDRSNGTFNLQLTDILTVPTNNYPTAIHNFAATDDYDLNNDSTNITITTRPTAGTWAIDSVKIVTGLTCIFGDGVTCSGSYILKQGTNILVAKPTENGDPSSRSADVYISHSDPLVDQIILRFTQDGTLVPKP